MDKLRNLYNFLLEKLQHIAEVVQDADEGAQANLEGNAHKFIHRIFWVGFDGFFAGSILAAVFFWMLSLKGTVLVYLGIGTILGLFCYGFSGAIATLANLFIKPSDAKIEVKNEFQGKVEKSAYRRVRMYLRFFEVSIILIILWIIFYLSGAFNQMLLLTVAAIFAPCFFVVGGAYLFICYILDGVAPSQEQVIDFLERMDEKITSKSKGA